MTSKRKKHRSNIMFENRSKTDAKHVKQYFSKQPWGTARNPTYQKHRTGVSLTRLVLEGLLLFVSNGRGADQGHPQFPQSLPLVPPELPFKIPEHKFTNQNLPKPTMQS